MLNRTEFIGYVGTCKEINNGHTASIATSKSYKNESGEWIKKTTWHNTVCFGDFAKRFAEKVSVGDLIYVQGELTYNEKDEKKYTTIIIREYHLLRKKNGGESASETPAPAESVPTPANDDDLPF